MLGADDSEYTCELLAVGPVTCRPVRDARGLGLVFTMLPVAEQLARARQRTPMLRVNLSLEPRRQRADVELEDVLLAEHVG